uniref:Venom protein n=1 Tax=Hemiscolopendra marginata TaxID=943146 RepID=A0A646QJ12_9MYRI
MQSWLVVSTFIAATIVPCVLSYYNNAPPRRICDGDELKRAVMEACTHILTKRAVDNRVIEPRYNLNVIVPRNRQSQLSSTHRKAGENSMLSKLTGTQLNRLKRGEICDKLALAELCCYCRCTMSDLFYACTGV